MEGRVVRFVLRRRILVVEVVDVHDRRDSLLLVNVRRPLSDRNFGERS